jgi:hypothetical protein
MGIDRPEDLDSLITLLLHFCEFNAMIGIRVFVQAKIWQEQKVDLGFGQKCGCFSITQNQN